MPTETSCPLCQTPRAPGAKRCACNYTFEYDAPAKLRWRQPAKPDQLRGIVVGFALAAAVLAGWFASGIERRQAPSAGIAWMLAAFGVFTIAGGMFGWRWFLGSRRARLPRLLFGSNGVRVFYGVLGGALAGAGISLALT